MPVQPVMTAEEWFERMRDAAPPTEDDVTILWDGRRLDSREKVLEWLAEVEAKRDDGVTKTCCRPSRPQCSERANRPKDRDGLPELRAIRDRFRA